ncbi:MAG: hypothetical protein GQE15_06535 [Archangiaceae bacterium]|nr:hypothetical protein [Archangiaceae bacterium]
MSRVSPLMLALLLGCGGREATSLSTDLGAVEVVAPPVKPNPFTTPCLQVARAVTLPEATASCSRSSVDVPVTNTCSFPVRLSSERSAPFGVARLPLELGPNATESATFAFLPTSSGHQNASLQLVAQAEGFTQRTTITLDGTATPARTASVEARTPAPTPSELLIIVDDDGLPDAEREIGEMALWLSGTLNRVVVSDLSGSVQRPDDIAVLASESPAFIDRFTRAMHPPRSSGRRSCHETALSLRKQHQPPGFWSPDALRRTIVCIMNEADQSDRPASSMLGQWDVRFGETPTPFLVVAPFGKLDTCGVADTRLEQLALETGGFRETLCEPGWGRVIEAAERTGWLLFVLKLPVTPTVRSVERLVVTVDGAPLPSSFWRFDTFRNAVLIPAYPEPGQVVRATWETCDD